MDPRAKAAQLKKIREIGKKKQEQLMEDCKLRQARYFGETQHKFLMTTDTHGAQNDDDYGDEEGNAYQTLL